jgi:plasmid stability protein
MAMIQVRNVPDPIYRRLAEQAEREHRSLAQQTLAVLSRGLGVEMDAKARRRKVLQAIAGMDHSPTKKLRAPARLIREDRNR